nr:MULTISPECIES: nitroreductase [unclassified Paraburkholderia]
MDMPVTSTPETHTTNLDRPDREAFFDTLLARQSAWPLVEPGPGDAELELIFDAALRAPDHGRLRPWRFAFIRGEARAELGETLVDVAAAREPGTPRSAHEHRRDKAFAAPLIIALGAAINRDSKVPELEQVLSAGAATMNMLNAIYALGYGGFWATGPDAYDDNLKLALNFEPEDKLLGFLFVGTPKSKESPANRALRANHFTEWLGSSSI